MMINNDTVKRDAQRRSDQIHAFRRELAALEKEDVLLLDEHQARGVVNYQNALLAEYRKAFDVDGSDQEKRLSWGMKIASLMGALALAASLFFLFYQFWGWLGTASQVVVLIAASLGSFLLTIWVGARDGSGYYVKLVGLMSFACFVLNITMIGQIFNITPSDNALLAWAVFALLLAYAYDIRLLQVVGILCVIAFFSARMGAWGGMYWLHFGERPENFIPIALLLFFLPQWLDHRRFTGFAMAYRVMGAMCLFIPLLILSFWGQSSYLKIDLDLIEGFYQLMGFALSAGLIWLGIRKNWLHAVNTGVFFFVLFLYSKFFDWWWVLMPKYLFFMVLGLMAVLLLVVLTRFRTAQYANVENQP